MYTIKIKLTFQATNKSNAVTSKICFVLYCIEKKCFFNICVTKDCQKFWTILDKNCPRIFGQNCPKKDNSGKV